MKKLFLFSVLITLFVVAAISASANPIVTPLTAQSVVEGSEVSFDVVCSAPDNGVTAFSKDLSTGNLVKVSDTKATFSWTPTYSESGTYTFTFTAQDDDLVPDNQQVTITVEDAVATLSVDDIEIGSSSQKRKNGVDKSFTVRNTGNVEMNNIVFSAANVDPKYNVEFSPTSITSLAPSATSSVTVTVDIPDDHPAIDSDFNDSGIVVGQVQVSGVSNAGAASTSPDLSIRARNMLVIDKVIIEVNGAEKTLSSDGKTLDDLKPFDELDFDVYVENKFSDSDDIEFEDVEVRLLIDDDGFSLDDSDTTSISTRETEYISFSGDEIDSEADGKIPVYVYVTGDDEEGALHGETWKIYIDVDRKNYEIEIISASLSPSKITCDDRDLRVSANIRNIGKNDDEDVVVQVQVPKLDIDEMRQDIDLASGDSQTEVFYITIPEDADPVTATDVYVKTYYKTDRASHSEILKLDIADCSTDDSDDDSDDDGETGSGDVVTDTGNNADTSGTANVVTTSSPRTRVSGSSSSSGSSDSTVVGLLIAGIVVVLVLIASLLVVLLKGAKK